MAATDDIMRRGHDLFDPLADAFLSRDGVDLGWIFGSQGLRIRGKIFGFLGHEGDLVVKLPAERVAALVSEQGARRLRTGEREMREWLVVTQDQSDLWAGCLEEAFAFVDRITP
jgi:hypothetical protein